MNSCSFPQWFELLYQKQLAKTFEGEFDCLEENTEKYKIFSVSIKKRIQMVL